MFNQKGTVEELFHYVIFHSNEFKTYIYQNEIGTMALHHVNVGAQHHTRDHSLKCCVTIVFFFFSEFDFHVLDVYWCTYWTLDILKLLC